MGKYAKPDEKNFDGTWKEYLRIRVMVDVRMPMKQQMKLKKSEGKWLTMKFKFERLPTFCFFYGRIGHSEHFCEMMYDEASGRRVLAYGPELRAEARKVMTIDGSR